MKEKLSEMRHQFWKGNRSAFDLEKLTRDIIESFCAEVNQRAEENMLKTGKLEGSHHAAMKEVLKELGI